MGQIDDIMKDINKYRIRDGSNVGSVFIHNINRVLEKHLEPQKKAEVCSACYGKKEYTKYTAHGIETNECPRCKGIGEEPVYIPDPQQEDKKAEEYIPRCVKCGNSIKWDYDDEYCCECGAKFKQQEDNKIELLSGQVWIGQDIPNKINEIINHINLHLDHKSL